eukprot:Lankesteria_metandrocarpae@DN7948_c0_g1_i1.p1
MSDDSSPENTSPSAATSAAHECSTASSTAAVAAAHECSTASSTDAVGIVQQVQLIANSNRSSRRGSSSSLISYLSGNNSSLKGTTGTVLGSPNYVLSPLPVTRVDAYTNSAVSLPSVVKLRSVSENVPLHTNVSTSPPSDVHGQNAPTVSEYDN